MNIGTNAALAVMAVVMACAAAGGASADTRWERHHPRQDQVFDRLANQNHRIAIERREGDLSAREAHRLHRDDRLIARQDRRDSRFNGGYISRGEQRQLNREENGVSRQIGR